MNQFMDKDIETLNNLLSERLNRLANAKGLFDLLQFDYNEAGDIAEAIGYKMLDISDKIRRGEFDKI